MQVEDERKIVKMPLFRDDEEMSRAAFHAMLSVDIANPETDEVNPAEYSEALQRMVEGQTIHVGRDERSMHTYRIAK